MACRCMQVRAFDTEPAHPCRRHLINPALPNDPQCGGWLRRAVGAPRLLGAFTCCSFSRAASSSISANLRRIASNSWNQGQGARRQQRSATDGVPQAAPGPTNGIGTCFLFSFCCFLPYHFLYFFMCHSFFRAILFFVPCGALRTQPCMKAHA